MPDDPNFKLSDRHRAAGLVALRMGDGSVLVYQSREASVPREEREWARDDMDRMFSYSVAFDGWIVSHARSRVETLSGDEQ